MPSPLNRFVHPDATLQRIFQKHSEDGEIDAILGHSDNEWAISRSLGQFLARIVTQMNRRAIIEYGAGTSSLVLATALARIGGGQLTSIEHQPEYCRDSWATVQQISGVDARLVISPLRLKLSRYGLMYSYSANRDVIKARAPYDLAVIDAPPGEYGRDAPLYEIYPLLQDGAVIVLDDAARSREQTTVRRWLETFPGLRLAVLDFNGRGTAVLIHRGDKRRNVAPRAILGTFHDRITYR